MKGVPYTYDEVLFVSKLLKCISSPQRLLILCVLSDGGRNVSEILKITGTTKGNISQHLRILENMMILTKKKVGNKVFYDMKDQKITTLLKELKKLFCSKNG